MCLNIQRIDQYLETVLSFNKLVHLQQQHQRFVTSCRAIGSANKDKLSQSMLLVGNRKFFQTGLTTENQHLVKKTLKVCNQPARTLGLIRNNLPQYLAGYLGIGLHDLYGESQSQVLYNQLLTVICGLWQMYAMKALYIRGSQDGNNCRD